MSPHCSKTSWMISSVAFSGNPPTKTVLHPGGRSLVEGGGRSENHNKTQGVLPFTYFCSIYFFFFLFSDSPGKSHTRRLTFSILSDDERLDTDGCVLFSVPASFPPLRSSLLLPTEWLCPSMNRDKANVSIISFLLHYTEAQKTGGGREEAFTKHKAWWNDNMMKTRGWLSALSCWGIMEWQGRTGNSLKAGIVLTWLGNIGPGKNTLSRKNYSHLNEQTPKFEGGCIKR